MNCFRCADLSSSRYFCSDKESHYIETWHVLEDLVDEVSKKLN